MNANVVALLLLGWCFIQDPWKNIYSEQAWVDRDRWQRASELIGFMEIKPESIVADIGCHEGYMTVKLSAKAVQGKIYAVDVEDEKLERLKTNLKKRQIENVIPVKGEYSDPKLPGNQLDAVMIIDTYHEMKQHDQILQHVWESLKIGGRLVICEPIAEERKKLSRQEQENKHELGINFALADLRQAGFTIIKSQESFADRKKEKGDTMWVLVAVKR